MRSILTKGFDCTYGFGIEMERDRKIGEVNFPIYHDDMKNMSGKRNYEEDSECRNTSSG